MIHFRGYSDKDLIDDTKDLKFDSPDIVQQDSLMTEIFAPDPVTGKPRSDLHFIYSKDYNPVVAEYIRQNMCKPIDVGTVLDNPDDALELTKSRFEADQQYVERLQAILSKPLKKD